METESVRRAGKAGLGAAKPPNRKRREYCLRAIAFSPRLLAPTTHRIHSAPVSDIAVSCVTWPKTSPQRSKGS